MERIKKKIEKINYWLRSFKKIKTVKEAQDMGLTHLTNVHGDAINYVNCRSYWKDKYGNSYRCSEFLAGGASLVFNEISKNWISLPKNI